MKTFSFYDTATGLFSSQKMMCSSMEIAMNSCMEGCTCIEGDYDHLSKKVVDGEVVDYVPESPGDDYEWNEDTFRWEMTEEAATSANAVMAATIEIARLEAKQARPMREWTVASGPIPEDPEDAAAQEAAKLAAWEMVVEIDAQIAIQRAIIEAES